MRKTWFYISSYLLFAVLVLGHIRPFMEWWAEYRTNKLHAPYTRARYGDLFSSCFLPQFIDTGSYGKLEKYKSRYSIVDLYVLHDSYLANKVDKQNFVGIDSLLLVDFREEGTKVNPATGKKSILIIECAERSIEWRMDSSVIYNKIITNSYKKQGEKKSKEGFRFNSNINQNLEFLLFDYEWLKPIKEAKAETNFYIFNKTPPDVAISYDKKYLYLAETVDPSIYGSSFFPVSWAEIDQLAENLSKIRKHYLDAGFHEVYFSFVPNPVSVLEPWRGKYNHKMERIEESYAYGSPLIDVYKVFLESKKPVYRRDDSHWNTYGLQLWVNAVNQKLAYQ
jgi:hypothetical protein